MTAQQRAKQIYNYMGSFSNAEGAVCLLWNNDVNGRDYWEEVWEALIYDYADRDIQLLFEPANRKYYIEDCTPL